MKAPSTLHELFKALGAGADIVFSKRNDATITALEAVGLVTVEPVEGGFRVRLRNKPAPFEVRVFLGTKMARKQWVCTAEFKTVDECHAHIRALGSAHTAINSKSLPDDLLIPVAMITVHHTSTQQV